MNLRDIKATLVQKRNRLDAVIKALDALSPEDLVDIVIAVDAGERFICEKCSDDAFVDNRGLQRHRKMCDGVLRTEQERRLLSQARYMEKKTGQTPRRLAAAREEAKPNGKPNGQDRQVQCIDCGTKYGRLELLEQHQATGCPMAEA